jgi:hypothetical protein
MVWEADFHSGNADFRHHQQLRIEDRQEHLGAAGRVVRLLGHRGRPARRHRPDGRRGESFRLRFGAAIHQGQPENVAALYRAFLVENEPASD